MKAKLTCLLACWTAAALLTGCEFEMGAPHGGGYGVDPVVVTDANFDQVVLGSSQPVMVDFWADWCGPCRNLKPTIHELAADFQGQAVVAQLDTDENTQIAERYQVTALPTLLFFKNGQLVDTLVGYREKDELSSKLAALVGDASAAGAE
ncbi:MAG: thioredoxin [Pirellulaceae bacterium]